MSEMSDEFLDLDSLLEELMAEKDEHYEDPGKEGYDPQHEDQVRSLAELVAFYDESGPRSDPDGDYRCGSCQLRQGTDRCLYVQGIISFTIGSCNIYVHGETALEESFELKEKFDQTTVGYAERPEAKGFGCKRCEYGAKAKAPDQDGRPSWCREWGMHIEPTACCMRHIGPDMVLGHIKNSEESGE